MENDRLTHSAIRFGAFELDLRAGELRKQGIKIKLQEQPFQILAMLHANLGQVVTREELRSKLWPADTFVDFDHSLNKAINKLREALGDSAENPRFIETLSRRGYRFLLPIEAAQEILSKRGGPIDSIAVFPLAIASADPDADYLAFGIPGSIIHSLSRIPKLRVIACSAFASNRDREADPLAIGRKLGVRAVLIGRIWQRSNKLRLQVDLVDTLGGEELWGEQYDRDLTELFVIHDEISREVSRKLRFKLTGEDESRLTRRHTDNIEAYQLCVRGRRWCEKRSVEGFRRGIEYLSQAIQMDPNYALAHAELAQCISVPCYYGSVDPNVAYPKAKVAALRALEIDPNLAEGHEVLATVLQNYDWDWAGAEKEYQLAIELNPNYAIAHYHYAYHLSELGRFEEAIRQATEALSRDPMSGIMNSGLAFVLLHARKLDWCVEQCLTAIEVDPHMTLSYLTLGTAYEQKGMYQEAITTYERGLALGGAVAVQKAMLSHVYAESGERAKACEILRELQELSKTSYVAPFDSVIVYDGLGERELAIECLQKAYENRDTLIIFMKVWPQFDRIREDPRFQEIERRIGLRQ
jgi:TolB-like protein